MKKQKISEAVQQAFESDKRLSSTLAGKSFSFRELTQKGYITFELDAMLPENVDCRLIVTEDKENENASLNIICRRKAWQMEGFKVRPMELASLLIDALNGKISLENKELKFHSMEQEILTDDLGLLSVNYYIPAFPVDIPDHNPIKDYEHILSVIVSRLANHPELVKRLGGSDGSTGTMSASELCSKGYISLGQFLNGTAETFLMVSMDCRSDLSVEIAPVTRRADANEHLKVINEQIADVMAGTSGTKAMSHGEIRELGDGRYFSLNIYSLKYNPETFDTLIAPKDRPSSRPHFFCDIKTLQAIANSGVEDQEDYIDFNLDVIELPYTFAFRCDAEYWKLRAIFRGEIYSLEEDSWIEKGHLDAPRAGGQANGTATDKVLAENMGFFFSACRKLSHYSQAHGLEKLYKGLDPENGGILFSMQGEEIRYKAVRGKARPALMVSTLFGGAEMRRPYGDEVAESSKLEFMSLEQKIEAAENGDENCMDFLCRLYLNGDEETEANPEKAFYWAMKLAESGSSIGMFNVGLYYAKGYGVKRDFAQAAYWEKKAAEAGDDDGAGLAEKFQGLADNLEKAKKGDAEAQAIMANGLMLIGGILQEAGSEKDYAEALEWAQKAAAKKNGQGIWALALAYEHGRGVEEDTEKAVRLFQRGADLGDAACMQNLACHYMQGDGVKEDQKKGFELFIRAAKLGNVLAMKNAGHCYQFGNGVEEDMDKAIEWFEKALEVEDDAELAQKVEVFKMLQNAGEDSAENPDEFLDASPVAVYLEGKVLGSLKELQEKYQTEPVKRHPYQLELMDAAVFFMYTPHRNNATIAGVNRDTELSGRYKLGDPYVGEYGMPIPKNDEGTNGILIGILAVCDMLDHYFTSIRFFDEHPMIGEKEGILIGYEDGELSAKLVSGKDRPDLTCLILDDQTLVQGKPHYDKWRPYKDEDYAAELKKKKKQEEEKRKAEERKREEERKKEEARRKAEEEAVKQRAYEEAARILPERRKYCEYAAGLMNGCSFAFAYVKPDGTVQSYDHYFPEIDKGTPGDTSRFSNIKSVVCTSVGIVGLRNGGSCACTNAGRSNARINACESWYGIRKIVAGDRHVLGLREDGTCCATPVIADVVYGYYGQSDVDGWSDIVDIAAGDYFSVGVQRDGHVVLATTADFNSIDVSRWENVEMIASDGGIVVALTKDGRLLCTGHYGGRCTVEGIDAKRGIVQLAAAGGQAYALYADGTVGGGKERDSYGRSESGCGHVVKEKNVVGLGTDGGCLYVLTEDGNIHKYITSSCNAVPYSMRIFDSYDAIVTKRMAEEKQKEEEEKLRAERKAKGVCIYCGGTLKRGLLFKKCVDCGKRQ